MSVPWITEPAPYYRWLRLERGRARTRPEPYHQALFVMSPIGVQGEGLNEGGEPAPPWDLKSPGDDTHADTVPRTGGPSPSSSQSSHHNDTGRLKTLFVWATYQTKRFKINKGTFKIKNNFLSVIILGKTHHITPNNFLQTPSCLQEFKDKTPSGY